MPRKGKRSTVTTGVYRDSGGYTVRVTVGGTPYEARMPADSTLPELKAKRAALANEGHTATPRAQRRSLTADVATYLRLIQHLRTWRDRQTHLAEWVAALGDLPRHRITEADVRTARDLWRAQIPPLAPKTINHRIDTLRQLYHRLDGRRAPTPCDDVVHLRGPKTIIQRVSDQMILDVDRQLQAREQDSILKDAKTRARFRVFVSTGKRPCEIMRAQPQDVNLEARVWVPRDAKGGYCPGVYLNDDQRAAWHLFFEAQAWGPYNLGSFARTIRAAGWPADVRPYQARHTTWITASERGIDLEDIAVGAGHSDPRMTRRMYVPVLNSRLQRLGEALNGRFQGWPVVPKRGTPNIGTPAEPK